MRVWGCGRANSSFSIIGDKQIMPKIEKSRFSNITIEMVVKGKGNKGFESEDQESRGGTNLPFYKKPFFY